MVRLTGTKRPRDPRRIAGRAIKIAGGSIIITPRDDEHVHVEITQGITSVEMVIPIEKARIIAGALTSASNRAER